jgi:saccharopine dehydrogenase (NADP+, L-glutamate forming)
MDEADEVFEKLQWAGLFDETALHFPKSTAARNLQHLLEQKWKLEDDDKDMIVMHHELIYKDRKGKTAKRVSSLIVKGEDSNFTAMAKTVGLPLGITAMLILKKEINLKGVLIPVLPEVYQPVLSELEKHGIVFREEESLLPV